MASASMSTPKMKLKPILVLKNHQIPRIVYKEVFGHRKFTTVLIRISLGPKHRHWSPTTAVPIEE